MELKEIIETVNKDMHTVPPFITGIDDKEIFDNIVNILGIVKKLMVNKFVTAEEIEHRVTQTDYYLYKLNDYPEKSTRLAAYLYIDSLISNYITTTLNEEIFEACSNLTKYKNML